MRWVGKRVYGCEVLKEEVGMKGGDVYKEKLVKEGMCKDEEGMGKK